MPLKSKPEIHAVIMAGGRGERFWPYSREGKPKQFLALAGLKPLIAETVDRLKGWIPNSRIWVVTNAKHTALVRRLCPQLKKSQVVGEPVGKDTAPCIAVAAALIAKKNPNAVMVVLPADHRIGPRNKFTQVLQEAADLAAERSVLVTLGIPPRSPHTGYGYIHAHDAVPVNGRNPFYRVNAFKEKPNLATAKKYLRKKEFYWNSGIFIWRADTILEDIQAYLPKTAALAYKIAAAWGTRRQNAVLARAYGAFEKISIDYGVLEKAQNVIMAKAPFQWDDLGSWSSLSKYLSRSTDSNSIQGNHVGAETRGCTLVSHKGLIATLGVSDLVIVATPDVTLVAAKDKEQELKKLLGQIRGQSKLHPFL